MRQEAAGAVSEEIVQPYVEAAVAFVTNHLAHAHMYMEEYGDTSAIKAALIAYGIKLAQMTVDQHHADVVVGTTVSVMSSCCLLASMHHVNAAEVPTVVSTVLKASMFNSLYSQRRDVVWGSQAWSTRANDCATVLYSWMHDREDHFASASDKAVRSVTASP